MLSIRALESLVTTVEQGSLTKAAAALHMSQPALPHQTAGIERELGTPVIERLPRRIRPNAAGLAAVAESRIVLAAADRAVTAGRRVAGAAGGRIRIACAETMTAWVLVPVLSGWRRRGLPARRRPLPARKPPRHRRRHHPSLPRRGTAMTGTFRTGQTRHTDDGEPPSGEAMA